jgi:sugar transferase (PEP-CTERM/EpsH1 system associated)
MRILYVLPYVPSLIRVRPYNFIRELTARHEVTLLATGSPSQLDDLGDLRGRCYSINIVPLRLSASLRNCAVAALHGDPLQAAYCRSSALVRRLITLLHTRQFDVVHVEHLRAAYVRTAIPLHVPSVFDAVDCISLLQERTLRSSHSLRQRGLAMIELHRTRRYEAQLLGRFDSVLATSAKDATALEALASSAHVRVIPNGVDLEYFRPLEAPQDDQTIVFSGKMSYHANVSAVMRFVQDVLPRVRMTHSNVRFVVVGSQPPTSITALARDPSIVVTGHLRDIRPWLGRASLAVCPVTVKVGIQNKILEAMAMGVPVVSSPLGVEGLAARPDVEVLVGNDPAQFAAQVNRLLEAPALRDRLARAGRQYVEDHHRWDSLTRLVENSYADALAAHGTSGFGEFTQ